MLPSSIVSPTSSNTHTNYTRNESNEEQEDFPLTNVSKNQTTTDEQATSSPNRLRRRVKCESPTIEMPAPSICNAANKTLITKNMQRDRLSRALSVQKQLQQQHQHQQNLKRIVFNGTFPIDDPYSSRFVSYVDEHDEYYEQYDDEDDGDEDEDDDECEYGYEGETDNYRIPDDENGISIHELASDKHYFMNCSRIQNEYHQNVRRFPSKK